MATSNTFALLGMDGDEDDGWQDVTAKKKGKEQMRAPPPPQQSSATSRSGASQQSNTATAPRASAVASVRPQTATSSYGNKDSRGGSTGQRAHDYYKAFQTVFRSPKTGETVLRFHQTEVVRIRPDGGVILNSGGFRTMTTLLSMNDALGLINMRVVAQGGADSSNWTIKDESGNYMYADNCLVSAKKESDTGRAAVVLAHYQGGGSGASTNNGSSGVGGPKTPSPTQPTVRPTAYTTGPVPAPPPPATLTYQEQYAQQQAAAAAAAAGAAAAPPPSASAPASSASSFASMLRPGNAAASMPQSGSTRPTNPPNSVGNLANSMGGMSLAANPAPEEEGLDDDSACIVCMCRRATMLLLPCGHSNMCPGCWRTVEQKCNECPTCRQPVTCSIDM